MSQIKALSANERSRAKMLLFQNFHNRKLGILSDNARTKERLFVRQQADKQGLDILRAHREANKIVKQMTSSGPAVEGDYQADIAPQITRLVRPAPAGAGAGVPPPTPASLAATATLKARALPEDEVETQIKVLKGLMDQVKVGFHEARKRGVN